MSWQYNITQTTKDASGILDTFVEYTNPATQETHTLKYHGLTDLDTLNRQIKSQLDFYNQVDDFSTKIPTGIGDPNKLVPPVIVPVPTAQQIAQMAFDVAKQKLKVLKDEIDLKIIDVTDPAYIAALSDAQAKIAYKGVRLEVQPRTLAVKVGDTFNLDIFLDTDGNAIDGVDVNQLHFDPALISVTKVLGTLLTEEFNQIKSGTVAYSAISPLGQQFKGTGVLCSLTCVALKAGTSLITIDAAKGDTIDSNVATPAGDILEFVINGSVLIK